MKNGYVYKHNPIVKKLFMSMLIPTIFMNLTTAIASMADTIFIGQFLDDASLSVVTFATPIFLIINVISALFAVGGCISMSIDAGKGEKEEANKAFSISLELLMAMGIALFVAGAFFSHTITGWLGAGEDVFESVELYSRIILMGGPFFVLNTGLAFFVRNDGRPTLSMVGMFSSIFVDISLNFVFIGIMKMGVAGAAYSTVIGSVVSVLIISTHFLSKKNTIRFKPAFDSTVIRIVKNGGSTALQFIYQFVTVLIINHFLASIAGTQGVVIYTVILNLATVALSLFEGISQTIQPMISNYYGEKSYRKMKDVLWLAFCTILLICGSITVILEIIPQCIPLIFGIEDTLLMANSVVAVRIYTVGMIITTLNVVITYYLQSIEQNFIAVVIVSLRNFVLFLCAVFALGKIFGMNGIWASYPVAEVFTFVVCIGMILVKRKKLLKSGNQANILLLDERIEKDTQCYTFYSAKDDFPEFCNQVTAYLKESKNCSEQIIHNVNEYLSKLKCGIKKGNYIEVEWNDFEKKIIVRDNLKHADLNFNMQDAYKNSEHTDYGPVLGWNRFSYSEINSKGE